MRKFEQVGSDAANQRETHSEADGLVQPRNENAKQPYYKMIEAPPEPLHKKSGQ